MGLLSLFMVIIRISLYISLPSRAPVYGAPARAAVHSSSRAAAPAGFDQSEPGSKVVGI